MLPKVRDSWSYLYVEHAKIDQDDKAIAVHDDSGRVPVPCATLSVLLLGPGTTISHAAIRTLAEHGCLVEWTGEEGVRFYARGEGETRSAANFLRQARLHAHPQGRLEVAKRMYRVRFTGKLADDLTIQQLRGMEGARVRDAYARASQATGVPWTGRSYKRNDWGAADPINRALSCANSNLYGICHAAIIAVGLSPALGFVHTGKMLSFVYDVADLYKAEITIPAAFQAVQEGEKDLERRVRHACRDLFRETRLLKRIVTDMEKLLSLEGLQDVLFSFDEDEALPGGLWDPELGDVQGGVNFAEDPEA